MAEAAPPETQTESHNLEKADVIERSSTAKTEQIVENKPVDGTIPLSGDGSSQRATIGKKSKAKRKTKPEKEMDLSERKSSIQKAIESVADSEKRMTMESAESSRPSKRGKRKKSVKKSSRSSERLVGLDRKASNIELKKEKTGRTSKLGTKRSITGTKGKKRKSKAQSAKKSSIKGSIEKLALPTEIKLTDIENKERVSAVTVQKVKESDIKEAHMFDTRLIDRSEMLLHASYEDLLRREIDADSSSTSEDAPVYLKQQALPSNEDFLNDFQSLPDLDQLSMRFSSDEEPLAVVEEKPQVSHDDIPIDQGKFVDPLTGELIESSESLPKFEVEIVNVAEEPEEEEEETQEEEDYSPEFDIEFDVDEPEQEASKQATKFADDISTFQEFVRVEGSKIDLVTQHASEDKEALEQARILNETTDEFLRELIAEVVDKCESHDEAKLLRKNLDKNKLINDLYNLVMDHKFEKQKNELLNRKVIDFYKRKKILRTILPDPPEMVAANKEKYIAVINELDHLLYKEELLRDYSAFTMEQTKIELNEKRNIVSDREQKLESLIEKTIMDCGFPNIQTVVDRQLAVMAAKRNEISELRFALIIKQDTLAKLKAKMLKIEDLGNGLSMRKFEHMQTETQALDKKIEDKNSELNKVREYCNSNLHILTHMREKQQIILQKISEQEQRLAELQAKRKNYRAYLLQLKLQRLKIREELRELSFHGGLLDKPTLMLDYDKTVEILRERYSRVEQLRKVVASLTQRVASIEERNTFSVLPPNE